MATPRPTHDAQIIRPFDRPAGLRILIPGYPQWMWRQTERAAALGGMYAAAMTVVFCSWGTKMALAMLALAFFSHVSSAADAIRQSAFPGFGRWVPTISAGFGLGLGCYAPVLGFATVIAWTDRPSDARHESYAINLWAYRSSEPSTGDWVWHQSLNGSGYGLGRVVAGPGKNVEWAAGATLTIDGQEIDWRPSTPEGAPLDFAMTVPDGYILVAPVTTDPSSTTSAGLCLVPRDGVIGRPWARLYPVWTRRLLL